MRCFHRNVGRFPKNIFQFSNFAPFGYDSAPSEGTVTFFGEIWGNFYRAMLCIHGTSHGPVSACVCLSQDGVLLKRLNVGSHKQHHTTAKGL